MDGYIIVEMLAHLLRQPSVQHWPQTCACPVLDGKVQHTFRSLSRQQCSHSIWWQLLRSREMKYLKLLQGGVGMVQVLQLNWQLTKIELAGPCTPTQRTLKADVLP